jgi:hypothetical protein
MALAQEVATKGVTVNTVSPGYVGTDMVKAIRPDVLEKIVSGIPVKRLAEPEEIASIVAWIASDEGGYATGLTSRLMVVCIWDKSDASGHCCLLFDVNLNKFATVFLLQCGRICSPKQGFWWAYFLPI